MRNTIMMAGVMTLTVACLGGERAAAQGLGGTRPENRQPVWFFDPAWYFLQQQATQAQREAERQAAQDRTEEARRAALAAREAALNAAAGSATAAAIAAAHSANVASQTAAQNVFAAYKSDAARRHAEFRRQAALPTDLCAESQIGTAAAKSAESPPAASGNEAVVELRVPADAVVWFSGFQSHLTGPVRSFTTPALEKGQTYAYEVRVRWTEDGQPVEQTRKVQVRAGERTVVAFPGGSP